MKREEILNMPAGLGMDALIAEKLMGYSWAVINSVPTSPRYLVTDLLPSGILFWNLATGKEHLAPDSYKEVPPYSTDISAAWEVVEKMAERGRNLQIMRYAYHRTYATFDRDLETDYVEGGGENCDCLAICRAALLAVMEDK